MCIYNDIYNKYIYSLKYLFHRGFLPHDMPIQSGYIQILNDINYSTISHQVFLDIHICSDGYTIDVENWNSSKFTSTILFDSFPKVSP